MAAAPRSTHELDLLLKNGVQEIDLLGADEFIVLVGCTGSGKSTFLKFLLKDATLNITKNEQDNCNFTDGEATIDSENCLTSKTIMPNLRKDEETGFVVMDCAGFGDTRSEHNDLIASFLNKRVLDKARRIKLVIVERYDRLKLSGDRNAFMNVLSHVSGLLKNNHRSFRNSICLVATKIESEKDNGALIRSIKTFLKEAVKSLEENYSTLTISEDKLREMEILSFLIANSQIGLFRRPSVVNADPWGLPALQENFKNLRKLVFEDVEYTPDDCGKFNIVVAPKTQIWIRGPLIESTVEGLKFLISPLAILIEQAVDAKLGEIRGEVEEKLTRIAEAGEITIALLSSIKSLQDLENFAVNEAGVQEETMAELKFHAEKAIFYFGVAGRDENEIKELIFGLNGKRNTIIAKISQLVEVNNFILDLAKASESYEVRLVNEECKELFNGLNISNFPLKMANLQRLGFNNVSIALQALNLRQISGCQIDDLKALFRKKNENHFSAEWVKNGDCLLVLGRFVFLSQVIREINLANRQECIKQVVLAATEHLYIDCDLSLQHTHLTLIAPKIESTRVKRIIILKGEDAPDSHDRDEQAPASQDENPGQNGIDGNPGYSSGSFTLISLDIINPTLLEVRSTGGNGSNGQDGGNGRDAPECQFPTFEKQQRATNGQIDRSLHSVVYTCDRSGYTVEYYQSTQQLNTILQMGKRRITFNMKLIKHSEIKPTDGGKGGAGGSLAVAGDLNLRVENIADLEKVSINCSKGKNGAPGKGGKAGRNARGKFRIYECTSVTVLLGLLQMSNGSLTAKKSAEGECNSKLEDAKDGMHGKTEREIRSAPVADRSARLYLSTLSSKPLLLCTQTPTKQAHDISYRQIRPLIG
ncbi:Hypothetical predicted protein [Cloeon dipterum]|uniref:G domain-containing protein n=1 Tax=Cloeon dipterum TaxID=197152 RepID=A0A8S1DRE0_9INSE|nr:Hypothetical predicted protein [Cloeon dipterum]